MHPLLSGIQKFMTPELHVITFGFIILHDAWNYVKMTTNNVAMNEHLSKLSKSRQFKGQSRKIS